MSIITRIHLHPQQSFPTLWITHAGRTYSYEATSAQTTSTVSIPHKPHLYHTTIFRPHWIHFDYAIPTEIKPARHVHLLAIILPLMLNYVTVQVKRRGKAMDHLLQTDAFTCKNRQPRPSTRNFKADLGAIYDIWQKCCSRLKTYICKKPLPVSHSLAGPQNDVERLKEWVGTVKTSFSIKKPKENECIIHSHKTSDTPLYFLLGFPAEGRDIQGKLSRSYDSYGFTWNNNCFITL